MDRLKKIFIISVMMMTVLAMSAVVTPAVAAEAGDLVKMDGLSSVYYLGADGNRYVFPNEVTYYSWYTDFSAVVTIPQEELETYPLEANVTIRPGTKLVTSPTNSMVYAVGSDGTLQSIVSEENAIGLWGEDWASKVVDIVDSFFTNYTVGDPLTEGQYPAGQLIKATASPDVYYFDGTNVRAFTDEASFLNNRFSWDFIETVPDTYTMPAAGTAITGIEDGLIDTSQGGGGIGDVAGTGLTVALASDTPAAATIPQSASIVFLKFNLTASNDGDVGVTSIKLTAGGLGTATNIKTLALYNDGNRIGNIKSTINSSNEATFNLSTPLAVQAGATESVTVRAAVTSGTQQHLLGVKQASDITTNGATVSGSFPINGNTMSVSSVTVGQLTIATDGSPSNPDLGDVAATIAKFKLTNNNVEDITFNSIILKRSAGDAADDDFENMTLNSSGAVVATSDGLLKKYVSFVLDTPMLIEKGKTKKFQVKADIIDGAAKTVTLSMSSNAIIVDIDAIGEYYGQPTLSTGAFTGTSLTIQAGEVSLGKENAAATSVRKDSTNVEFGTIKITANSAASVEMTTLILTVDAVNENTTTDVFDYLSSVEILDRSANTVYELEALASGGDANTVLYSNTEMGLYLTSGQTKELVMRGDIDTLASTSQKYTFKLSDAIGGDMVLKETGDETTITDITPNSLVFKQVTVKAPALTFTVNAQADTNEVVGTTDVKVLDFNMEANSVDDLKITELKFKDRVAGNEIDSNVISGLNLYKELGATDELVDSMSAGDLSSEEITFADLELTVSASESVTYYLTVDFVADANNDGTTTKWGVSGYTAEDATEGEAVYDTTNDSNTDGVVTSGLDSGRTVTLKGSGALYITMDNTNSEANKDSYVVANTQSDLLAAIEFRSDNEQIDVSEIMVFHTSADTINTVMSKLYLVDSDKSTVLAEEVVTGATTTIDSFTEAFLIGETSRTVYLKADYHKIGKGEVGQINASSTFTVSDITAEGVYSSAELSNATTTVTCAAGSKCYYRASTGYYDNPNYVTDASQRVGVLGINITDVDLVESGGGALLDTALSTGWLNAAIIKITTDTSDNRLANGTELKLILDKVKVKVEKNTATGLAAAGVSIERLGGDASGNSTTTADTVTSTSTGDVYARLDLSNDSNLGTDEYIEQGSTVYFLVKVNVDSRESGAGNDWIRVSLDLLNGETDAASALGATLKWRDGTDANVKYPLRLSNTKIDGFRISEPS